MKLRRKFQLQKNTQEPAPKEAVDKRSAKDLLFAINIGMVNLQHFLDKLQRELTDTMADVQLLRTTLHKGDDTLNLKRLRELHLDIGPRAAKRILKEFCRIGKVELVDPSGVPLYSTDKFRIGMKTARLSSRKPNHRQKPLVVDVPSYRSHC